MSNYANNLNDRDIIIPFSGTTSKSGVERKSIENKQNDKLVKNLAFKTGTAANASGSAYLEVNNTSIEVLIFGPKAVRGFFVEKSLLTVKCNFLSFLNKEKKFHNEKSSMKNINYNVNKDLKSHNKKDFFIAEQKISTHVESVLMLSILLERYPKTSIELAITINSMDENDSTTNMESFLINLTSWIINCSSLALIDAGIEIKDLVTSGHVRLESDSVQMDPYPISKEHLCVDCMVSFMTLRNDEIVGIWIDTNNTNVNAKKLEELIDQSKQLSRNIRSIFNYHLLNLNEM